MIKCNLRWLTAIILAANLVVALPASLFADQGQGGNDPADKYKTTTPIKHVVIIFQENESFDHYFGTYPNAKNPKDETRFNARPGTPSVNGLNNGLQNKNPNGPTYQPFRLDPSQNYTCDQNAPIHARTASLRRRADGQIPAIHSRSVHANNCRSAHLSSVWRHYGAGVVMGYYDGNTITAFGTTRSTMP